METEEFHPPRDPNERPLTWDGELLVVDAEQPVAVFRAIFAAVFLNWFVLRLKGANGPLYYAFNYDEMKFDLMDSNPNVSLREALGLEDQGASRVIEERGNLPEAALPSELTYPARNRVVVLGTDEEPRLVGEATASEPIGTEGFDDTPAFEPTPPSPPLPKNDQVVVRIFYATDRKRDEDSTNCAYLGQRGNGVLELGTCDIGVPRNHLTGSLERKTWWKVLLRRQDSYFTLLSTAPSTSEGIFYEQIKAYIVDSEKNDLFVFIHGFDVTFEDAAIRTAQLAYDLGFKGAPVLYSWPSMGHVQDYVGDKESVNWSKPHLKSFLRDLKHRAGPSAIHLIAHSMGNLVMARCLSEVASEGLSSGLGLKQVILTAPDIDRGEFLQLVNMMRHSADRLTLYASSEDKALKLSQSLHSGYARAGEAGENLVVVDGIDTIDASVVDTSFLKHSYVGTKTVASDIFYLITQGLAPDERYNLIAKPHPNGKYWAFQP